MLRSLALKELRELAGIAALALAAYAVILMHFTYWPLYFLNSSSVGTDHPYGAQEGVTFLQGNFRQYYFWIAGASALAYGFRQTVWEENQRTWSFLIHRPIARWKVYAVKLSVGLALCLSLSAIPILLYGCWSAYIRQAPAPFAWSMAEETWVIWWCAPLLYLSAFLSGLRPARWIGTKLFPLGAGIMATGFASAFGWQSSLPVASLFALGLILCIHATNTFRDLA